MEAFPEKIKPFLFQVGEKAGGGGVSGASGVGPGGETPGAVGTLPAPAATGPPRKQLPQVRPAHLLQGTDFNFHLFQQSVSQHQRILQGGTAPGPLCPPLGTFLTNSWSGCNTRRTSTASVLCKPPSSRVVHVVCSLWRLLSSDDLLEFFLETPEPLARLFLCGCFWLSWV